MHHLFLFYARQVQATWAADQSRRLEPKPGQKFEFAANGEMRALIMLVFSFVAMLPRALSCASRSELPCEAVPGTGPKRDGAAEHAQIRH